MRSLIRLAIISFTLANLSLVVCEASAADCSEPKTATEFHTCWQRDWTQKDLEALVSLYSQDAALMTSEGRIVGRDQIRAYWKPKMDAAGAQFTLETATSAVPDNLGYDSGSFHFQAAQVAPLEGNYLFVLKKDAKGSLRLVQQAFVTKQRVPVAPCPTCFV